MIGKVAIRSQESNWIPHMAWKSAMESQESNWIPRMARRVTDDRNRKWSKVVHSVRCLGG